MNHARRRPSPSARALVAGAIVAVLAVAASAPACAGEPACTVDLLVEFSPSVPRPSSNRFLDSLVQGSGYSLRHVRTLGMSHLVRLTGPDSTCDAGIDLVRRHPTVKSLDIDEKQFRNAVRAPEAK